LSCLTRLPKNGQIPEAREQRIPSQMLPCEKVGNGPRDFNGKRELVR